MNALPGVDSHGVATIVFGFAVGRFSIALQEFLQFEKNQQPLPITAWLGMISIVAGVPAHCCGTLPLPPDARANRYEFIPTRGAIIDLVAVCSLFSA